MRSCFWQTSVGHWKMKAEITIPGRPITKKNHQQIRKNRRTGGRFIAQSEAYQNYETECLWELKKYRGPKFTGPIRLTCRYWVPDRRGWPDLPGLYQATADILEKAGIIDNDRNVVSMDGSQIVGIDRESPRVEIEIEEVDD